MEKRIVTAALALVVCGALCRAQEWCPSAWPVLRHYDVGHLYRISLPMGGIGTGTVSLGGRGELRDWSIMNVPGIGYSTVTTGNNAPFFAIYAKPRGGKAVTALLEGPLYSCEYLQAEGRPVNHHGMPRFSEASFDAAYPFGTVYLSDAGLPVEVEVKGFNPFVPCDADASGIPVAVIAYEVRNVTGDTLSVSVCGSLRNFIGKDGSRYHIDWKGDYVPDGAKANRNVYRDMDGIKGIYFSTDGVEKNDPAYGTMALTTEAKEGVSYRTSSKPDSWNNALLNFWDDFGADGIVSEQAFSGEDDPMASLAVNKKIGPGESRTFTFFLTWSFPNRKAWSSTVVGNYYCKEFPDAWTAAEKVIPRMPDLEKRTLCFVNAFVGSSYPDDVKEAALFNLAALRSQTVFRLPDGHLMGWEGVFDQRGSCYGSCTHVWNYEMVTPFLFGSLARTMRDVEFNHSTRADGLMNFRTALPLSEAAQGGEAAADGQMGCVMKFYREWQMSGDNGFLRSNWQQVKKVLSFAWVGNGWDGNKDGVMEGAQHNTMDVAYFGPNPQMGFWYMGALRAAEEMAKAMHDRTFERTCRRLFERGSTWMDGNLFDGDYYEQKITDPRTFQYLNTNDSSTSVPDYQLGKGCLVDQLVGQGMAHLCGLGYLGDKDHMRTAMRSVMKYNFVPDCSRHFNNMRSYVLGHEGGLLMASWPKGRLRVPFPYFSEMMTGFEYSAITEMIYEGFTQDAMKCVKAIRARFDGAKRNPFSEPECGHYYARSMASWAMIPALSDFSYSGVERTMNFTSREGRYFWSNGYSWGTCTVSPSSVRIDVLGGTLVLKRLTLSGRTAPVAKNLTLRQGESFSGMRK